jgi:hypothetical protein
LDQQTIYMEMYKECCNQGRHHETQRSTITTVCFSFASAVLAYITAKGGPSRQLLGLSIFLMILGIVAFVVSYKQYERFRLAMDRAEVYRNAIDGLTPKVVVSDPSSILVPTLGFLKEMADAAHKKKYRVSDRLRLHHVWSLLFLLIAVTGGWFTFASLPSVVRH